MEGFNPIIIEVVWIILSIALWSNEKLPEESIITLLTTTVIIFVNFITVPCSIVCRCDLFSNRINNGKDTTRVILVLETVVTWLKSPFT